jgi:elongation factor G
MDMTGASFFNALDSMRERLGANVVPIQLPIGKEENFQGIVDLITMKAELYLGDDLGESITEADIPAELLEQAKEYRGQLVEAICEQDDNLMEKFLMDEEISIEELKTSLRAATIKLGIVPVVCGSSYKNKGVQLMLDAMVDYLPSPLDIPPIRGTNPRTEQEEVREADDDAPFSALAFKVMTDEYVGKLCFFRIYSGSLKAGSYVLNASKDKRERIGRILLMHANHREDVEEVHAGDIAAVVGLKNTSTGDTLCFEQAPIILESMDFPEPVISVAVEPKSKASQDKMTVALAKLADEDPTFKTRTDEETGQIIISGMGELHLDIIVDRLFREFKVEANVGMPQVAYRETITQAASGEGRFVRQSGGHGQYGHAVIDVEPLEAGEGFIFEDKTVGGVIPKQFIKPIEEGIREAMQGGTIAGYPMVDIKASLRDGSYHEVDSSEVAFRIAGSMALRDAVNKAKPVLMEPVMQVDIIVPTEYLGDVLGDVSSRRGRIQGMDQESNVQKIHAFVPLSEMFGYATALRSRTQGRGVFTMQISHFEQVPASVHDKIVKGG